MPGIGMSCSRNKPAAATNSQNETDFLIMGSMFTSNTVSDAATTIRRRWQGGPPDQYISGGGCRWVSLASCFAARFSPIVKAPCPRRLSLSPLAGRGERAVGWAEQSDPTRIDRLAELRGRRIE